MCYDSNARPPMPPGAARAAHGEDRVLQVSDGNELAVYVAVPEAPYAAQVLIYPDVRGLHQFYKHLALRFAEQGVAAAALDYFGRTAGLTLRDDAFEFMPHVMQLKLDSFLLDVHAALDELRSAPGAPRATFTLGFCFGGSLSLLTGTKDLGLSGVVSFYAGMSRDLGGAGTVLSRAAEIKYPTLALFGGTDASIPPEQVEALDIELDKAGVTHVVITYPGAPHSFFDRRAADYAEASANAWTRVLQFFAAEGSVA